jgi:Protein of unknown function (DUF1761)
MNELKINHLAILVCVILAFALGSLWFGPFFGEKWMTLVGINMATMKPPGVSVWIINFVASLVPLYVLAWLLAKLNVISGLRGAGIGLLISFSFHFLMALNNDMFAGAPYALPFITGGYSLVSTTISGFILGAWTKTKKS